MRAPLRFELYGPRTPRPYLGRCCPRQAIYEIGSRAPTRFWRPPSDLFSGLFSREFLCQAGRVKTGSADIAALNLAPEGNLELGDDRRSSSNGRRSIVVDLFKRRAKKVQDYLSFRLRSREDGEDAMQDAFLKMWRREVAGALCGKTGCYPSTTAPSALTRAPPPPPP